MTKAYKVVGWLWHAIPGQPDGQIVGVRAMGIMEPGSPSCILNLPFAQLPAFFGTNCGFTNVWLDPESGNLLFHRNPNLMNLPWYDAQTLRVKMKATGSSTALVTAARYIQKGKTVGYAVVDTNGQVFRITSSCYKDWLKQREFFKDLADDIPVIDVTDPETWSTAASVMVGMLNINGNSVVARATVDLIRKVYVYRVGDVEMTQPLETKLDMKRVGGSQKKKEEEEPQATLTRAAPTFEKKKSDVAKTTVAAADTTTAATIKGFDPALGVPVFEGNIYQRNNDYVVKGVSAVADSNIMCKTLLNNSKPISVQGRLNRILNILKRVRPFYGAYFGQTNRIALSDLSTAAVDGVNLLYNPVFIANTNESELLFIMLHEMYHNMMNHITRRGHRKPYLWNVACDLFINKILQEEFGLSTTEANVPMAVKDYSGSVMQGVSIEIPGHLLFSNKVDTHTDTPEKLYAEMQRDLEEQQRSQSGDASEESSTGGSSNQGSSQNSGQPQNGQSSEQQGSGQQQGSNSPEQQGSGQSADGQNSGQQGSGQENGGQSGDPQSAGQQGNGQNGDPDGNGQDSGQQGSGQQNGQQSGNQQSSGQQNGQGSGQQQNGQGSGQQSGGQGSGQSNGQSSGQGSGQGTGQGIGQGSGQGNSQSTGTGNSNGQYEIRLRGEKVSAMGNQNQSQNNGTNGTQGGMPIDGSYKGGVRPSSGSSGASEPTPQATPQGEPCIDGYVPDLVKQENNVDNDNVIIQKQRTLLDQAIEITKKSNSYSSSSPDVAMLRVIEDAKAPVLNWKTELRKITGTAVSDEYRSLSTPDRRFIAKRDYYAGKKQEKEGLGRIFFAIDTSGSITQQDLGIVIKQIEQLMKIPLYKNLKAEVIYWDTNVVHVDEYDGKQGFSKYKATVKAYGGGGTCPDCVFDYIKKRCKIRGNAVFDDDAPIVIAVFTDGCFSKPQDCWRMFKHTLWVISTENWTSSSKFKPPWGRMVQVKSFIDS